MHRRFGRIAGGLIAAAALLLTGVSAAQNVPAPDVVVLKDGSRYRGIIAEATKDGPVTIVLVTGETRQLQAADVSYAGPAAAEPTAAPAATPAISPTPTPGSDQGEPADAPDERDAPEVVRVRFESNRNNTEFFVRASNDKYRKICTAPCVRGLEPATYRIGVRFTKEQKVKVLQSVLIEDPTTLVLDFRSNGGMRDAGGVLLVIGCLAATASTIYLASAERPDKTLGYIGLGTGVGSALVGLTLASFGDDVALTVK
jgi:hypothetical protein